MSRAESSKLNRVGEMNHAWWRGGEKGREKNKERLQEKETKGGQERLLREEDKSAELKYSSYKKSKKL